MQKVYRYQNQLFRAVVSNLLCCLVSILWYCFIESKHCISMYTRIHSVVSPYICVSVSIIFIYSIYLSMYVHRKECVYIRMYVKCLYVCKSIIGTLLGGCA